METSAAPSLPHRSSWLSLVAEAAGALDCGIARVHLFANAPWTGSIRALVQVLDASGCVVGATEFLGRASDLEEGVLLDVGYSATNLRRPLRVVAWLDETLTTRDPFLAPAPNFATELPYSEVRAMKLMLQSANAYAA